MSVSVPAGLVERCKNILLKPKEEWSRIDPEPASVGGLMTGWVIPLAAIGPVAGLIGGLVFGYSAFGVTYRPSMTGAITTAVIGYVMSLISVFVLAKVIDFLAPNFGGTKNDVQAMKVAAYSSTASYLAGIFQIIPALSILGILGLYSLYLLYLGLPRLMKAPAEKAMSYTIVTVIAAVVIFLVAGAVTTAIASAVVTRAPVLASADDGAVSGTVNIPGIGSVDVGKMQEAGRKMEAAAKKAETATPVDREALAGLLPDAAGGWTRESVESSSVSAGGFGGSQAEARYVAGEKRVTVKIVDTASAAALTAMASAFKIESSRQTSDGYEKTGTVDGRFTIEKWRNSGNGSYAVLVADRFMVEADGDADDIGALKALVGAVDEGRLKSLAG